LALEVEPDVDVGGAADRGVVKEFLDGNEVDALFQE
jgi:hypothetical protein